MQVARLERNLSDEIPILTDERLKRLDGLLGGKAVQVDLHDERTNKRLLTKDVILDRETIERISDLQSEAHQAERQGPQGQRADR